MPGNRLLIMLQSIFVTFSQADSKIAPNFAYKGISPNLLQWYHTVSIYSSNFTFFYLFASSSTISSLVFCILSFSRFFTHETKNNTTHAHNAVHGDINLRTVIKHAHNCSEQESDKTI